MKKPEIKIFCDFDGTIAVEDIGNLFYREFGDPQICDDVVSKWREGKITSIGCLSTECRTIRNLTLEKAYDFIDQQKIDETFIDFVKFCKEKNLDLIIISDGLDLYINYILKKYNLDIKFFANSIRINDDGTAEMIFPYSDSVCLKCANCKRNHIINNSSDDDITIYIGDGHSDRCPIEYVDYIFAKKHLLKYCEINRISYSPFENFSDVKLAIEKLLSKKRIKKRNTAILKRRELYLLEP
ncbi:MAG: MtnX-like HAD-IB family phosphatase [Ignavibacteria bacterium]|nr:MtnX-like HAD-IB family phosphatase [Ignavibacteria bacterium]